MCLGHWRPWSNWLSITARAMGTSVGTREQPPPPPYGNPVFPVQPRTVARTVGSQNHSTDEGQWTIYWKLNIVAGADFSLLSWWENASLYMGMPDLADRAITALTLL